MEFSRRKSLMLGLGGVAAAMLPVTAYAAAEAAIAAFTGGAAVAEGGITITAPEIAENGNTVPVEVAAPGAVMILLLATGNPNPEVCQFTFGPLAAKQAASTRIRLSATQDVIALAKMGDGSFVQTATTVKVTIGGCGG